MSTPLNDLRDLCHSVSAAAGWWTEAGRDLKTDKYVWGTKVALIHSEISEMLEGSRKGKADEHLPHRKSEEVEAADALIRIFDYAGARGLDLDGAVREKMAYNAQRADHKLENRNKEGGKAF